VAWFISCQRHQGVGEIRCRQFLIQHPPCIRLNTVQVLTTYAVLESCFRKQQSGFKRKGLIVKEPSPLHQIKWNRIIVRGARFQSYYYSSLFPDSSTKRTTSKNAKPIPLKHPSSSRVITNGACPGPPSRIALESFTAWSVSSVVIHFHIISVGHHVSLQSSFDY
jgi:hypothetical protein